MYIDVRYIIHQSGIQKLYMLEVVPCLIKISTVQKRQHRVISDPDVSVQKNDQYKMNKGPCSTPKPTCRRVSVPNADHGPCAYDDNHGLVLGVHPMGLAVDLHSGKTRTRTRSEPKPVWESLKTGRIPISIYMEYNSMKRVLKEMIK